MANFNSRALNTLFSAVTNEEFKKISFTDNAKEAWTILQNTYEGTKDVKNSKLQRLTTSFEEIGMDKDDSFDEFYAKLKIIVNSTFNFGEQILEPKIVKKIFRSLPERFHAKITAIEKSKDLDSIPLTELIKNLQIYELGLARVGKGGKGKNMALKTKNDDNDESSDDEDTKLKSYITRQFKKFIKNANVKPGDKDHKQSAFSQFKSQDIGKRESMDVGQGNSVPTRPKCYGCHGFGHMKQKCPTYLKFIGKSKALDVTLSGTEPKANSDESEQDEILSAFTTTIESPKEVVDLIDEEEELIESKFEKIDEHDDIHIAYTKLYKVSEKHEKIYRLATRKLSEVELEREKLSTKVEKANQIIGALRFENNLLVEKTKKLDVALFQVRAQLERISSAKLDEMLNFQKSALDKTVLEYDHSHSSCSTTSNSLNRVIFVPPTNNDNSEVTDPKTENVSEDKSDKRKSILGAPPKVGKKETKQNKIGRAHV